jgi:glycosyltransferase involved in cell wall biosynthesis
MTIVLLTAIAGNGGSAATLFHNARILRERGASATFFAPGTYWKSRGNSEGVAVENSLELRRGFRPLSFARDFVALRRFIVQNNVDAVIVQKSPEQWLAAFVLKTISRPVKLVRLRGVVFPIKPSRFNRWLHNSMNAVICSASVIADQFRALPGFKMDRVHVLLEGIDSKKFAPATLEQRLVARTKWSLNPDALLIGTAGRPSPIKGHEILVRAFAKAFPTATLTNGIVVRLAIFADESRRGPGSYQSLDELCRELKIRERVDLIPGFIDDMRSVYHALDAYVLPSLGSEGSSRAGLEACASGLPVLASRVGVLPDLIDDRKSGLLLPPGDVAALAEKLYELAATWPSYKLYGDAARERIVTQFSEEKYGATLVDLIEK